MKIVKSNKFNNKVKYILLFIAQDSVSSAKNFKSELELKIKDLVNFPKKFRSSIYYDDENVRDLIYKGYTIPYYIDYKNNKIVIITIFNQNLP